MFTKEAREKIFNRVFEIILPVISWGLLTSPFWASFLAPFALAYFIIFFDIYFFYRAALLGINSLRGYIKIQGVARKNWLQKLKDEGLPWEKMRHIVLIPTYKESEEILSRTRAFLAEQEFPAQKISVCIATEKREEASLKKAEGLRKRFGKNFSDFWITQHALLENEVAGKSSNLAFAAREVKKYIESAGYDKDFITVTSCDSDVSIHPKYFSVLTYQFLKNDTPHQKFWKAALLFSNTIWRVPLPIKVVHTIYSINGIAQLLTPGSNFNYSSYSLSWRLLEKADFWDVDVVPEDWHLFFKAFFANNGNVELESIFLPLYADAAEGQNYWESLKAQYFQNRRWAWGVTDVAS